MAVSAPHYRPDIQGLRAVAVLTVIAYHAGLPLPGGFLGVDMFFVISGYVITALLLRELNTHGRIRLPRFYARRFLRLTPALALMVTVTVIAALLLQSPLGPAQTTAATGIGALLMVANFVIASTTGDYFDPAAETNPLLHTWSLSVEEQFYLAFPFILLAAWKLHTTTSNRRLGLWLITGLTIGTFLLATTLEGTPASPLVGFYGPIGRAWEFLAGALLALLAIRITHRLTALTLATLGAALITVSMFLSADWLTFPSAWTLIPVTGTLLLIAAGTHPNPISAALSTRPATFTGDRSYSLYLWHWPLIVFAALLWPDNPTALLTAAIISILPALASYTWVEQRFRHPRHLTTRGVTRIATITLLPALLITTTAYLYTTLVLEPPLRNDTAPSPYSGDIGHDTFHQHIATTSVPCETTDIRQAAPTWNDTPRCWQTRPGPVTLALIGDSHAEHLYPGLTTALPNENIAYYIVDDPMGLWHPNMNRIVQHVAATPSITTVILSAYWERRSLENTTPEQAAPDLRNIITTLTDAGKTVYITNDIPSYPFDAFDCKYQRTLLSDHRCTDPNAYTQKTQNDTLTRLATANIPNAHTIDTFTPLCSNGTCDMRAGGRLLYRDSHHLNLNGSTHIADTLTADLARPHEGS